MKKHSLCVLPLALLLSVVACARPSRPAAPAAKPEPRVAVLAPIEQSLMAAAVDSIAASWPDSSALCLSILGGPAGPEAPGDSLLASLRARRQVVRATACPPTYASAITHVDSLGRVVDPRPPGYVDPRKLSVGRPQLTQGSPGYAYGWVHVRESHGTVGRAYMCTVAYNRGRAWAHCDKFREWIS